MTGRMRWFDDEDKPLYQKVKEAKIHFKKKHKIEPTECVLSSKESFRPKPEEVGIRCVSFQKSIPLNNLELGPVE